MDFRLFFSTKTDCVSYERNGVLLIFGVVYDRLPLSETRRKGGAQIQHIVGQCLGGIAVVFGFFSFQQKTPKRILTFEIITSAVFASHYLLLNAFTGVAMNMLCVVQCVAYYLRDKRQSRNAFLPLLFAAF